MSIGDAIAGEVRSILYDSKNKSIYGNIAMITFGALIGYLFFGFIGMVSGIMAGIVEKTEIIDDDISILLIATIIVLVGALFF